MDKAIVVFDSGIGGLSVLQAVAKLNLGLPLVYLADQAHFPYGSRSYAWINSRLTKLTNWFDTNHPSALIVACNTATVNGIEQIRRLLNYPVVGVEPVIKPLASYSSSLLLATSATLTAPRTVALLKTHQPKTITVCPTGLVQAIEDMQIAKINSIISQLAASFQDQEPSAIGLSCTHYALVPAAFSAHFPSAALLSPSNPTAQRLQSLLPPKRASSTHIKYYTTGTPAKLAAQVQYYSGLSCQPTKLEA